MIQNIDWIFFDVGGVIGDESEFQSIREEYDLKAIQLVDSNVSMQDVRDVWSSASSMIGDLDENVIALFVNKSDERESAKTRMKELRAQAPKYYDVLRIRPEAKDVLSELSKTFQLGLMANQGTEVRQFFQEHEILEYFRFTDVSADHKRSKPDPMFYQAVLDASKADPLRSAMVDDNIERGLVQAKHLGMKTIWYRLKERTIPNGIVDMTIDSLSDLLRS
jgi:HAD superfamily hydrolase (TIGR01509 family)